VPQTIASGNILLPGTNFRISQNYFQVNLTTAQATLGASDYLTISQFVEGPRLRELISDVHSLSLLVNSPTVAPLKFSVAIRDSGTTRSLIKLCTVTTANTWQLIQLPNLPVWDSGGSYSLSPGSAGYILTITLACGTTSTAPAADVWQTGNYIAAPGMDNFVSKPTGTLFWVAFVQHEPGALSSTPIDCPFEDNLTACQRYFEKSYPYATATGAASNIGAINLQALASSNPYAPIRFKRTMAKTPTITGYSTGGAANNVRNVTGAADLAIAAAVAPGDDGFGGFAVTGPPASAWQCQCHYTADTGW
jgi:hypothetical protein